MLNENTAIWFHVAEKTNKVVDSLRHKTWLSRLPFATMYNFCLAHSLWNLPAQQLGSSYTVSKTAGSHLDFPVTKELFHVSGIPECHLVRG